MARFFGMQITNESDGVHLDVTISQYKDRVEIHLTEGLGNYSAIRIFINDDDEARVEVQRFDPDQEEYDVPEESIGLLLFGVRTVDGRNGW